MAYTLSTGFAIYFVLWWVVLFVGVIVFYVLFTPIWLGIRGAAWIAELRARRRTPLSAR